MKQLFVLFTLFLLGMSFASAGFWGESWNFLITGNVIRESAGISDEGGAPPSDQGSAPAPEPAPSDSGSGSSPSPEQSQDFSQQYSEKQRQEGPSQYQAPSFDQEQQYQDYQKDSPQEYQGTYCGDGNCDLQDGEQYSWCPQDCDESQIQDSYRGQSKGEDRSYYGAPGDEKGHSERSCPDATALEEMSAKCEEHGGSVTERTDPYSGCTISECFFQGQGYSGKGMGEERQAEGIFGEQGCQSEEEAAEQSLICEEFGSESIAVPSPPGCAPRIVCAQEGQGYGSGHLSYNEYQQGQERFESGELGSAQVLEAILKMDSIKIQLDGVQDKMEGIAAYYESQGDTESAENYREGAAILDQVAAKIDEQKTVLKEAIESGTLDYETIYQIRSDLKYSVDELLNQVISALLGVTYMGIAEEELEASDCGSNSLCFEDYFRNCVAGASFSPEPSVSVSIDGTTENDECVLQMSGALGSGICTVPNYRYATLSKESVIPYCEFSGDFEKYEEDEDTEEEEEESEEETEEEESEETEEEEENEDEEEETTETEETEGEEEEETEDVAAEAPLANPAPTQPVPLPNTQATSGGN